MLSFRPVMCEACGVRPATLQEVGYIEGQGEQKPRCNGYTQRDEEGPFTRECGFHCLDYSCCIGFEAIPDEDVIRVLWRMHREVDS